MKHKRVSKSARANVIFPVSRIRRYIKKISPNFRIAELSSVYLSSVLHYMAAEMLELSGIKARNCKRLRITPRHLFLAVADDEELKELLKGVIISEGGVLPKVHPALLPQKRTGNFVTRANINQSLLQKPANKNYSAPPSLHLLRKAKKSTNKVSFATQAPQPNWLIVKMGTKQLSVNDDKDTVSRLTVLSERTLFLGQKLTAVHGDILNVTADAVVNPTDKDFLMIGTIGQTLEKQGGDEFRKIMKTLKEENGTLAMSQVALSPACNTSTKYVIHCNAPALCACKCHAPNVAICQSPQLLEKTIKNCLRLADNQNFKSISLPLLSKDRTGVDSPLEIKLILGTIENYFMSVMSSSLIQVYFVLREKKTANDTVKEMRKIAD